MAAVSPQTFSARRRDPQASAKALRRQGLLPGVVYGHGIESTPLVLDSRTFGKLYGQVGDSTLVNLVVEGQDNPVPVIVKDVQYHALTHVPIHVDFQQVRMDEEITAEVKLELVGEAPAVKNLGAILVETLHDLRIECLPGDLLPQIEIDLSGLVEFGDAVHISDLKMPASWKLVDNEPTDVVVSVVEQKVEVEPTPVAEVAPTAEGEASAEATPAEGEGVDRAESKKS